ncbi:MAG: type II secretion system protein [Candidatus Marinimicrobia bacterium]|jgi:prepilin-type N-terminal cleavage/methylation domain-containing protein|nr:type II secretion system protein [Candidatus Neomarinimicrobiota bacterium]MBT6710113.1 type II secretion system protein [Candidatus Neomarinimicrobiota bacterium]MBT7945862.1 type II secretion system protein [Candidatus Neomarinimicrobiota bacterium]|tara:strand:- start:879 stop:1505 length:627 start_codon:yes stop_codon:yes gene_type:complete
MKNLFKKTSRGMTLMELSASMLVVSIIALGMTSGAQAVLLHYQTDTVRQDLRQYGNNIMREIIQELGYAQKVEIDGFNGFSRLKLYETYQDLTPYLIISCREQNGIEFNGEIPLNGALNFPAVGVYRGQGFRTLALKDFIVEEESEVRTTLAAFKKSFLHLTLTLSMVSDVMDEADEIEEEFTYHKSVFLGTSFILKKATSNTENEDA